ncbi:DUF3472 domain-containing protein [Limnovirga soli]|uniref:peptidylprolyl isomerase n=1 Tax=Limnovirga soli TaxID=2656915 RepID=A0A8J8FBZ7_9BACT|nr:DUF3472 domain-containing protein [Limnovirga soli]NNV55215.1 DUF3472 domain-containing protein [Limnovirga soli]
MKHFILLITIVYSISTSAVQAQFVSQIPGYTGYAIPAEDEETTTLFTTKNGLINWSNTAQSIEYWCVVQQPGKAIISVNARSKKGATLLVSIAGNQFQVVIPASRKIKKYTIGSINMADTGALKISITCLHANGKEIANIQSIELNSATNNAFFINTKERRNAASVHLLYPITDSDKIIAFYNEITVPKGADLIHTYYMACGFTRGYFGIQVNSPTERRVIFSIWDAGNEAVDRKNVADTNRVQLLAKGINVEASDFGNEGTGGHSHWVFNWQADSTYKFMVTAYPDTAAKTTIYAAYFFAPELKAWKFVAAFKAPKDGNYLKHLYSFTEDFSGVNGQLYRKAFYGNQWVQHENNEWKELTKATFSCDVTGRAKDRIDFGGGVTNNKFYLWNGGFHAANIAFGDSLTRVANKEHPSFNLRNNTDSAQQAMLDNSAILQAIQAGKIDTTGSVNGVYYSILKEGTGNAVQVTDTVTVFYKGSLFSNGAVFDSTAEKPISFPLNRLIKGWQLGVPKCKVGGTIRLYIPSGLAYAIRYLGNDIPSNSILVFDITVQQATPAQ